MSFSLLQIEYETEANQKYGISVFVIKPDMVATSANVITSKKLIFRWIFFEKTNTQMSALQTIFDKLMPEVGKELSINHLNQDAACKYIFWTDISLSMS